MDKGNYRNSLGKSVEIKIEKNDENEKKKRE
jgi:hypothetical protein